ncbi:unnamed protein product [Cunninghamella echinulata]
MNNTTFDWSSIIDKKYNSIDHLVDTLIVADCRHFKHYDELVEKFKNKVKIFYGDFELHIYSPFSSNTPIGILYEVCNFGTLHWNSLPLSRYFKFIEPITTIDDLYNIEYKALFSIYDYKKNKQYQDNQDIETDILQEFSLLKDICLKYETFGEAILPTPYDDILEMVIKRHDGNNKIVYLSTNNSFYYMILQFS